MSCRICLRECFKGRKREDGRHVSITNIIEGYNKAEEDDEVLEDNEYSTV
jgi:hypothetical protein